jgi:predicted transcriptional regulator
MSLDLKQHLRERHLTQADVARHLAVSEATVSIWAKALREARHRAIPAERARALADFLQIDPCTIRPDLWPRSSALAA